VFLNEGSKSGEQHANWVTKILANFGGQNVEVSVSIIVAEESKSGLTLRTL